MTAAIAVVATAVAFAAHAVGIAGPVAVVIGSTLYVALVVLVEAVHLDDRL